MWDVEREYSERWAERGEEEGWVNSFDEWSPEKNGRDVEHDTTEGERGHTARD